MKTTPDQIIALLLQVGRFGELAKTAKQYPDRYIIVACELNGPKGIGRKVAETFNAEHYLAREGDFDIWTFLLKETVWQQAREQSLGSRDAFPNVDDAQRWAVVMDDGRVGLGAAVQLDNPDPLKDQHWATISPKSARQK